MYSWGDGGHGVLGQGEDFGRTIEASPLSIACLASKNIVQVSCGWSHSAALTGLTLPHQSVGVCFFFFYLLNI